MKKKKKKKLFIKIFFMTSFGLSLKCFMISVPSPILSVYLHYNFLTFPTGLTAGMEDMARLLLSETNSYVKSPYEGQS